MSTCRYHNFVGLISGGKDSIFAVRTLVLQGHSLVCLANLYPPNSYEVDSYMFQSVGAEAVPSLEEAIGVPLYRQPITGHPISTSLTYTRSEGDEIEDLYRLLRSIKNTHPNISAVSCGAISSQYQRNRLFDVCERLNIVPLCPLWGAAEGPLLLDMISSKLEGIVIKTACAGLTRCHIAHPINLSFFHTMTELHDQYSAHICGEGGEYESFVLYCPELYKKRIQITKSTTLVLLEDQLAPVLALKLDELCFIDP